MEQTRPRRLSRWMPEATVHTISPQAFWIGCALLLALTGVVLYRSVSLRYALALLVPVFAIQAALRQRRMRRLAAERQGESICTFARALDPRSVDPWIIRAVHDQLQPYARVDGMLVPLRPTDRLYEELGLDDDELDDVARDIAESTGRTLEGAERNPVRTVFTVGDLVRFFAHQPLAS
ncbi:hypothetical protein [Longimicrobium sp.]|uniref:hypothetical protein n=1 Tax=Longimicrobium sp. TaxID=2029185 RepID=UPI003B3A5887